MPTKTWACHPAGYSLIEMLLVMTGIGIVLVLCVSLLFTMMKVDRSGRAQVTENLTLERLARQFRQDVRGASKGETQEKGAGITLMTPDGRVVEYRRSGSGTNVERSERGSGVPDRRDSYRLPSRAPAVFTLDNDPGQPWAVLLLPAREDVARLTPARPVRVEALLGKDHRPLRREEATP